MFVMFRTFNFKSEFMLFLDLEAMFVKFCAHKNIFICKLMRERSFKECYLPCQRARIVTFALLPSAFLGGRLVNTAPRKGMDCIP